MSCLIDTETDERLSDSIGVHVPFWSRDYLSGIGDQLGWFDDDSLVSRCDWGTLLSRHIRRC